ncbi:hypothetical protein SUGI_1079460 [Cryptomeria japonica]|nr:hypothetical protein SUGI_1079460 [Cryptomeria japonica]
MGMVSQCKWYPSTVECMLESYGDKCCNIKGYLKIKDLKEIVCCFNSHYDASKSPKTVKQYPDKVENLKKRFKLKKHCVDTHGPGTVTWSLFHQLDHIMANLIKSANLFDASASMEDLRLPSPSHSKSFKINDYDLTEGFSSLCHVDADMVLSIFGSGATNKGNLDVDCSLDNIFNIVGYNCKNKARLDFQEFLPEKKPPKLKNPSHFVGESRKCKSSTKSSSLSLSNLMQLLADALQVFFEVYARIKIVKMEMFTKLILEVTKLHSKKGRSLIQHLLLSIRIEFLYVVKYLSSISWQWITICVMQWHIVK